MSTQNKYPINLPVKYNSEFDYFGVVTGHKDDTTYIVDWEGKVHFLSGDKDCISPRFTTTSQYFEQVMKPQGWQPFVDGAYELDVTDGYGQSIYASVNGGAWATPIGIFGIDSVSITDETKPMHDQALAHATALRAIAEYENNSQ